MPTFDDICFLLYTHSDFEDMWQLNFDQLDATFPHSSMKRVVAINRTNEIVAKQADYNIDTFITYNDTDTYAQKMVTILSQINTPYVLFSHDNNIILHNDATIFAKLFATFKAVNADRLVLEIEQSVHKSPVIQVSEQAGIQQTTDYYYYFNVQTGIWKTHVYLDIFRQFSTYTYRDIENPEVQQYVRTKYKVYRLANVTGIVRAVHFLFPHYFQFLHVTMRQQWVGFHIFQDLEHEWRRLFSAYKLDANKRGWRMQY